jgi:hypothetical protein
MEGTKKSLKEFQNHILIFIRQYKQQSELRLQLVLGGQHLAAA